MLVPTTVFEINKVCDNGDNESSRYASGGVLLTRDEHTDKPYAVATDGRRLMTVTWQEDDNAEFPGGDATVISGKEHGERAQIDKEKDDGRPQYIIVPSKSCREAIKLAPKRSPKPILQNVAVDEAGANGTVKMTGFDGDTKRSLEPRLVEGRFPKWWRDAVPDYNEHNSIKVTVDAKYLAEIATLAQKVGGDAEHRGVEILVAMEHADQRAVVVRSTVTAGIEATGVIMPMSSDRSSQAGKVEESTIDRDVMRRFLANTGERAFELLMDHMTDSQLRAVTKAIREQEAEANKPEEVDTESSETDQFANHTLIVSDAPERVRACDVQRLVDSIPESYDVQRFLLWLSKVVANDNTKSAIFDQLAAA